MGISSDIFITKKEAQEKVKALLLEKQTQLIEAAIKGMSDSELTSLLNEQSDLYYYSIEKNKTKK